MSKFGFTVRAGDAGPFDLHLRDDLFSHHVMMSYLKTNQLYEEESTRLIADILSPGDIFVDVGAHIGWFSLLASRIVGPAGLVFAFEPDRVNFPQLLNHIDINQCANIIPSFMAIAERSGVRTFHINSDNDGGHALYDPSPFAFNVKTRIEHKTALTMAFSLDDFFGCPTPIKMLKIDTEGVELEVLRGCSNLLRDGEIRNVLAEANIPGLEQMGATVEELTQFMTDRGYSVREIRNPERPDDAYNLFFTLD